MQWVDLYYGKFRSNADPPDLNENSVGSQADHPLFVWCNYCLELETLYSRNMINADWLARRWLAKY